jgi:hypothetical protein
MKGMFGGSWDGHGLQWRLLSSEPWEDVIPKKKDDKTNGDTFQQSTNTKTFRNLLVGTLYQLPEATGNKYSNRKSMYF